MASGATITITGGTNMRLVVAGVDGVEADDYNLPRANVNDLLSSPQDVTLGTFTLASTFGYNQGGASVNPNSQGSTVLAAGSSRGLKDLQDDVQALQVFLNETSETVTDVAAGDIITAATFNSLMLAVEDCWNARFNHTPSAAVTDATVQRTTAWTNTLTSVLTWTFASEAACRAFFNGGGELGFSVGRTGGSASDQNTRWDETFTAVGDILLDHETTQAGSGTNSNLGFYELTTSPQQLLEKFTATAPYTADVLRVTANVNSTTNPTVITMTLTLTDAGDNIIDAQPDGTLSINARRRQPDVTGTGFSAFATPTDSLGAITGS